MGVPRAGRSQVGRRLVQELDECRARGAGMPQARARQIRGRV